MKEIKKTNTEKPQYSAFDKVHYSSKIQSNINKYRSQKSLESLAERVKPKKGWFHDYR
jgi:hypothetical protein